ncbi:MAG: hypothetical protein ABID38_07025 [Candidatus Diapherotrites archaeon]
MPKVRKKQNPDKKIALTKTLRKSGENLSNREHLSAELKPMKLGVKGFDRTYKNERGEIFGVRVRGPTKQTYKATIWKVSRDEREKNKPYAYCEIIALPSSEDLELHNGSLRDDLLELFHAGPKTLVGLKPLSEEKGRNFAKIAVERALNLAGKLGKKSVVIRVSPNNGRLIEHYISLGAKDEGIESLRRVLRFFPKPKQEIF